MKIERRHIATASTREHMARRDAAELAAKAQYADAERVSIYALLPDGSYLCEVWDRGATSGRIAEVRG